MKIVVVSDNHGDRQIIEKISRKHPDADYYFHLGDSEEEAFDIRPFISVKGNNDYDFTLPMEKIVDCDKHSFYLTHGNAYSSDPKLIARIASMNECDIALFGHIHEFFDQTINGVRVINPGSTSRPRLGKASYAVIDINANDIIHVSKIEIDE